MRSAARPPLRTWGAPLLRDKTQPFTGIYARTGVFGGLALGSDESEFHTAAAVVRASIDSKQGIFEGQMLLIALVAVVLLAQVFKRMAEQVQLREHALKEQIHELRAVSFREYAVRAPRWHWP